MKNLLFFLSFILLLVLPASPGQAQQADDVEQTGGIFPTESQGQDTNTLLGVKPTNSDIPSPGFSAGIRISSQTQNEVRPHYFILDGYVDIASGAMRLQADHAEYDTDTRMLVATGNVVLDQEGERVTGEKLVMNMDTQLGTMYKVFGYVAPQIFFWGSRLEKIGKEEYQLFDGTFTECSQIKPHWRLVTSKARMTINEYIHFRNFQLKAKQVPIFYSPYMMWPIRRERATGFLFPMFGPNSKKGFYTGGSFFWAMTRSMDSTYWLDHWMLRGWGGGVEYRYQATEKSGGSSKFYYADDSVYGPQWSLNTDVNQELPADFRLASVIDLFPNYNFLRDTENSFSRVGTQSRRAQGFLTRNWSYYSLNFLTDWSELQHGNNNNRATSYYHIPQVQFQSRSQKLFGAPVYWGLESSFDELGRGDRVFDNVKRLSFFRMDLNPSVSWPFTYISWLTLTPSFNYRTTYYSNSQKPQTWNSTKAPTLLEESLLREYMEIALDLRGPNFARIFDTPGWGYSKKWKHAIEPQVTFSYRQNIDNIDNIIKIDDLDQIYGEKRITYSITNLLYSKRPVVEQEKYKPDEYHYYDPPPSEPPVESPWEFISWRVSQTYNFTSDSYPDYFFPLFGRFSPINSTLRVNPSQGYNAELSIDYDVFNHNISQIRNTFSLRSQGYWYTNLSFTRSNPKQRINGQIVEGTPRDFLQVSAGDGLWKNRVNLRGEIYYDIHNAQLMFNSLSVLWNDDCFSVGVEWRHYNIVGGGVNRQNENQFMFNISLPNIGGLINYRNSAPPSRY